MKRGFQKSLALLLAVFMTFGAAPFLAFGIIAYAADPTLVDFTISDDQLTLEEGQSVSLTAIAFYSDNSHKTVKNGVRWSSDSDTYASVSSTGIVTAHKVTTTPVTIYANYTEGGVAKEGSCKVTVTKAPVYVQTLKWSWDAEVLLDGSTAAGAAKIYSFAYADNKYKVTPDNADDKSVTLSCSPANILQIDNVNKTFKVNDIDKDKETVVLTLTANGAAPGTTVSVTKSLTVYKDVPITAVEWNFKDGTKTPLFRYYEKNAAGALTNQVAVYYFMPTDTGDAKAEYKFTFKTDDPKRPLVQTQVMELCDVTFTSSDKRVIVFDEITGRIIPVGNGSATLTIKVVTPKGKVLKDESVTAYVQDSPYTPITSASITYDKAKYGELDCEVGKDELPEISLQYTYDYQLTAKLNDDAVLDNKKLPITVILDETRKITTAKQVTCVWESDNPDVAVVDQYGKVSVTGPGDAVIKLTINDNGVKKESSIHVHGWMTWWQALVAFVTALITFRWQRIPAIFVQLLASVGGLIFGGVRC